MHRRRFMKYGASVAGLTLMSRSGLGQTGTEVDPTDVGIAMIVLFNDTSDNLIQLYQV